MSADDYRDPLPERGPICPACDGPLTDLDQPHPKGDKLCERCDRICTGSPSERMAHKTALLAKAAEESDGHALLRVGVEAARLRLDGGS